MSWTTPLPRKLLLQKIKRQPSKQHINLILLTDDELKDLQLKVKKEIQFRKYAT